MQQEGNSSIVRELRAAAGLPIVLMAILSAALFIQVRYLLDLNSKAERADLIIAQAHSLMQLFVEEETGLRGFLVTGDESFLEPYHRALASVPDVQTRLEKQIASNPLQAQALKNALDAQAQWFLMARRLIIEREVMTTPMEIQGDLGKHHMDNTRTYLAELIGREEYQRDQTVAAVAQTGRKMILASGALIVAVVLILAFVTRRQLNRVGRQYSAVVADAQALNSQLRERIDERTRLLEGERAARAAATRANSMKEEFVATLSHELRTPLNAILGWTQLLRSSQMPSTEDISHGLEVIERNTQIQARLIDDLLDMSRILSGKMRLDVQLVNLGAVVQSAIDSIRPAAEGKQIRLRQVLDPRAGPVRGDPGRLQQVVWNLLSNAIKFTPRDGRIEVLLERVNSHVEITVNDSGQGITPEFIDHVFERFRQGDASTTRSQAGLGLGLGIARHLAELHGGTIRVSSPGEGLGATFTVILPLTVVQAGRTAPDMEHPTSSAQHPGETQLVSLEGVKVLVVDDEPDARDLVGRVLRNCHADVTTAASANEALTLLPGFAPHVLVSDIGMPGMDGYELLRTIRSLPDNQGGQTPAVALTAFARSEDRRRALHAGYQIHVAKPVEPAELAAVVASLATRRVRP